MARKYSHLAKQARERYEKEDLEMSAVSTTTQTQVAPPMAKKAEYLRDADGNIYLWTEQLAERGDLVAAFDPQDPEKYAADQADIALNRELELAKERAAAEEVARLEAVQRAEAAKREQEEAAKLAEANSTRAAKAEAQLQQEREEHAKQLAEMQAKIDAMAKGVAEEKQESLDAGAAEQKPRPQKRTKRAAVEEEIVAETLDDLDDFDN